MTIVCATHFSDSSLAAVRVAAQLARTHREPLWLVELAPANGPGRVVSPALEREAAALLAEGLEVRTEALLGPLAAAVGNFCTRKHASLLIVGDSHQTLGPLVVGPLDRFADRISVPVLIVRDAKPFEDWASGSGPLRVMLALDRTWRSTAAREWIGALAAYGAIDLVASYLWWPKDEHGHRVPGEDEADDDDDDKLLSQQVWVEAAAAFAGLPSNVQRRVRLEAALPHIGPQLLRLARAEHADVVVLGTHPHRGPVGQQWSVSHELLALAPMSVACIPEPAALLDEARLFDRAG